MKLKRPKSGLAGKRRSKRTVVWIAKRVSEGFGDGEEDLKPV